MSVQITVNYKDIQKGKLIDDSGSYGDVYEAKWKTKGKTKLIAMKVLRNSTQIRESEKKKRDDELQREIGNLLKFSNKNIVTLYGTSQDADNRICLLLEYADCGSLYNFLHVQEKKAANVKQKLDWMVQCARAVKYLHDEKTFHRDLKPPNMLLFDNYRTLKICDFGTVKQIKTNNTTAAGTYVYMAPEVCHGGKYTEKCDVFSYGLVFWEVMAGKQPLKDDNSNNPTSIAFKYTQGIRPNIKDMNLNDDFNIVNELVELCWDQNPDNRPSMKDIIKTLHD